MSDTIQCVSWALEQTCRVRQGDGWQCPKTALQQVSNLKLFSWCKDRPKGVYSIFEGICITGFTMFQQDASPNDIRYPETGMVLASAFGSHGGAAAVEVMCGDCPANSRRGELVGCTGN